MDAFSWREREVRFAWPLSDRAVVRIAPQSNSTSSQVRLREPLLVFRPNRRDYSRSLGPLSETPSDCRSLQYVHSRPTARNDLPLRNRMPTHTIRST